MSVSEVFRQGRLTNETPSNSYKPFPNPTQQRHGLVPLCHVGKPNLSQNYCQSPLIRIRACLYLSGCPPFNFLSWSESFHACPSWRAVGHILLPMAENAHFKNDSNSNQEHQPRHPQLHDHFFRIRVSRVRPPVKRLISQIAKHVSVLLYGTPSKYKPQGITASSGCLTTKG